MSAVTLTEEYVHARDSLAFTGRELVGVARMGFEHAFAEPDEREQLLRSFDDQVAALRD
jgi:adenosine deaminase